MDKLPTELMISITDHLFTKYHSQQAERQNQLAALALTCKRIRQVVTPILYETPLLLYPEQAEKYLRTFTGWITPFSRAKRIRLTFVPPRKLRSLTLCTTLEEDPPTEYRQRIRSDDFALSFILEAALYLHPLDAFRLCPVTTAEDVFPTRNFHHDTFEREVEDLDSPAMGAWGDEDLGNPSPEFLLNCRHDYDFFVSHFEYDYEQDWTRIPLASIGNFQQPHATPAPFSQLVNLSLCIASTTHLLLILKTVTFSSVKNLTLYGRVIHVADNHITILRLAFTNYEGEHGFCYGSDLEKITLDDDAFISQSNAFLVANDNNVEDHRYDENNTWPILEKAEVEIFGINGIGPRLEMLDLRDLWLFVK